MTGSGVPFKFQSIKENLDAEFTRILNAKIREKRNQIINSENVIKYRHGRHWQTGATNTSDPNEMQTRGTEATVDLNSLKHADPRIIDRFTRQISKGFHDTLLKDLYQLIQETTDRTGNVVHSEKGQNFAISFIQMLRKIEFGIDRQGRVSIPEVHAGRSAYEKITRDMQSLSPKAKKEIGKLKLLKETKALIEEDKRRAKFVGLGRGGR